MKHVLLLNADYVQSICLGKSFKDQGWKVTCFCNNKCSSGYVSRYLDKRVAVPNSETDPIAFQKILHEYIKKEKVDLIIPMIDVSAKYLSQRKAQLEEDYGVICAVENPSTFDLVIDKLKLMELCEDHNIPHPYTIDLSKKDWESRNNLIFPALIKPNVSAGARGITIVNNIQDIYSKLPEVIKNYGNCSLQEFIIQPDYYYNVMMYRGKNGKILAKAIIKILRFFPLKGGTSCYCETIENEELAFQCEKLLNILDWHGFADFDVLEDKVSKELKIIEINPRVPSSLQGGFAAGIDFGKVFVSDIYNLPLPIFNYKSGQQIRWFGLDVMWFLFSSKRFKFRPSWFRFWGHNVSYQDGSLKNPLPMIAGCLAGLRNYINPEVRKTKLKR